MKEIIVIILSIFIINSNARSQEIENLSAIQIIDASVIFSGGDSALSEINTLDLAYSVTSSENQKFSFIEKKLCGKSYAQSKLMRGSSSPTIIYNNDRILEVNGGEVTWVEEIYLHDHERLKLMTYPHIQFGYKQLGYEFKKKRDEKFQAYDCYQIEAIGPNGFSTINFIDKENFRLVMVIFPGRERQLMIDYKFENGILINTHQLNLSETGEREIMKLQNVKINSTISEMWFNWGNDKELEIPDYIKMGKFSRIPNNGGILTRNTLEQIEISSNGEKVRLIIFWLSESIFNAVYIPEITEKNPPKIDFLVKIVSWNESGYVCHVLSLDGRHMGTAEYKRIE